MKRQLTNEYLFIILVLMQTIPVARAQTDSLTQQRKLVRLDSVIRANYSHNTQSRLADSLLADALTQAHSTFGDTSPLYASFLMLKGQVLSSRGLDKEAVQLLEKARTIYKQFPADTNRAESLARLAQAYVVIGPLTSAQDIIREAEEVVSFPSQQRRDFVRAFSQSVKAKIFLKLYDYKQAFIYQQQAVDGYSALGGAYYDNYYPDAGTNLASVLSLLQRNEEAQQQLDRVKSYLQRKQRLNDKIAWKMYLVAGQINLQQKKYDQAEDDFLRSLLAANNQTVVNSLWLSMSYNILANLYKNNKKDAERAEYYFALSRSSLSKTGMTNDFLTARALNDLALLHFQKGQYQQATTELTESQRLLRTEQQGNFGFATARQKETEIRSNQEPFINAIRLAAHLAQRGETPDTLLRQLSYDAAIYLNGLLLDDARQIRQTFTTSNDTTVRRLYTTWVTLKQNAADSLVNSPRLREKIDRLEQQMARLSTTWATGKAQTMINWRQISEKLQPADAAITFVRFPAFDASAFPADSILYAALIVRPRQIAPALIVLCSERQLRATLANRRQPTPLYVSRGTEVGGSQHLANASALYRLLWQPLLPVLAGVKRIFYTPGGLLHGISLAGLRVPSGKTTSSRYLSDRYELRQLFSTREVATGIRSLRGTAKQTAVLVGGVDYGTSAAGSFDPLPGSGLEVQQIASRFVNVRLLRDTAAREGQIKALSGHAPAILHFATHGFYRPGSANTDQSASTDSSRSHLPAATDPLQRSGLALTGANQALAVSSQGVVADDGILTAYEVALLDLSQTRLVVLSACETALGDVEGSEGVYGLQRAFRLAGADKLIVSLRPVPDRATQQLMTLFYTYMQQGSDVHNALRQAQDRLRQQYPDPAVWAAFVLIE